MKKEIKIKRWIYIFMMIGLFVGICTLIYANEINNEKEEQIKQLKQNNIEQIEEKKVYRNRCKMLEDLIKGSGLVVDDCECN